MVSWLALLCLAAGAASCGGESATVGGGESGGAAGDNSSEDGSGGTGGSNEEGCDAPFECDGAQLLGCVDGETLVIEECESEAFCDADAGECQQAVCEAGEVRCSGATLQTCSSDRTGFVETLVCDSAEACDADNALCQGSDCTPGSFRCVDSALLTCGASGSTWELVDVCAASGLCNVEAGQCDSLACEEDICDGATLLRCNEDGTELEEVEFCASEELCNAEAGQCDQAACEGGDYRCDGAELTLCNPDRTGFDVVEECGEGEFCRTDPAGCVESDADISIVGDLDGRLVMMPCGDTPTTDDCNGGGAYHDGERQNCQNNMLDVVLEHEIGGTPGLEYLATLHIYGIVEPKNYGNGVTREAGNGRPDLEGGEPLPWAVAPPDHAYPGSNYNSYELRVRDENGAEVAAYYMNSDTQEGHYTMLLDFERTIPIVGGGTVVFRMFDANCRQMKNCGTQGGYPCATKARAIDVADVDPPVLEAEPPDGLLQPSLGVSNDHAGQWVLIDVTAVAPSL